MFVLQEENISMQYVNDSCRVVYAYEMPPCPALLEEAKIPPLVLDFPTVEEPDKFSATHTNSGKCNWFFDNDTEVSQKEG